MADPLSISASVAGLLSLVIQVADGTYQYVSSARNASSTISSLLRELQALKAILVRLDDLIHSSYTEASGDAPIISPLDIEVCREDLQEIYRKLNNKLDRKGSTKALHRFAWPFLEDKTLQMVAKLHRYVEIFHLALSADSCIVTKATLKEVKDFRLELKLDARQESIIQWLSPESQSATHQSIRSQRQKSTGQWFLDKISQIGWPGHSTSPTVLWCRGIPGAGKTVLTSLVIDHATTSIDTNVVAYFYFNYKHQDSQKIEVVLCSLLSQLLAKLPELWSQLDKLYESCEKLQSRPTLEDALDILLNIENPIEVIFAIDALDEASVSCRDQLLRHLNKLAEVGFRILLTSRPDINLRQLRNHSIVIDITAQKEDLEVYTTQRLQESMNVQDILEGYGESVIRQLVELAVSHAAGMFLLVVFQTDYICQQTNAKEMMEAAKSMPPDAKSIYSRTMDQINCQSSNQANQANRILIWLTFACRNLTPQELVEALAVEDNTGSLDPLNKSSPTTLARICRGLVIVDEKNNIVQLAHRTVQDFLLDLHEKNRPNIQNEMCSICLTYLSFDVFRGGPSPTTEEFFRRDDNHFFLHYACWHLEDHFLWAAPDEALLERMYELITCKPLVESYLQARSSSIHRGFIIQFSGFQNFRGQYTAEPTALHVATMIGRSLLVDLVLTRLPHLLNQTDGIGRTALALAVTLGSEDIVRSLLDAGADTSIVSGETLLNCAARNRYDAIVDLLLHHQPLTSLWEFPSEKDERAQQLLGAFIKGDEKLARRLLELGVDVDARDVDGGTALQWAAWYGYSGIVAILLDYGADVDAADHTSGRRALHEAAKHGHLETLKLLLVRGAKVDARDRLSWTPLHHAATQGGWRVVEVLLQHGADVNAKTSDRKGPLDLACQNSQLATIPLLLQHGADIKSEDYDIEDIKIWATKGRLELDGKDIIVLAPLDGV